MRQVWLAAMIFWAGSAANIAQRAGPEVRSLIEGENPVELWFEDAGGPGTLQSRRQGIGRYDLRVRNSGSSPILMMAFKVPCQVQAEGPQEVEYCGTTEINFHYGLTGRFRPVEPGELRAMAWSSPSGGTESLMLESILFADGRSVGKREPYAGKYLESLLPSVRYLESLKGKARMMLSDSHKRHLELIKEVASNIAEVSRHAEHQ